MRRSHIMTDSNINEESAGKAMVNIARHIDSELEVFQYLDFEDLINRFLELNTVEQTEIMIDLLIEFMSSIEKIDPNLFRKLYFKAYIDMFGYNFDMDTFEYAVSQMKDANGIMIEKKWDINTIKQIAEEKGILPNQNYNEYDVGYIANEYASKTWDKTLSEKENTDIIFKFTKSFLQDTDVERGKAMRFFTKVAMWRPKIK